MPISTGSTTLTTSSLNVNNQKGFAGIYILIIVLILAVLGIQYLQYRQVENKSCGGDFSYKTQCSLGTYCQSLNQGPLAGGLCEPYLAGIFDLFKSTKTEIKTLPTTPSPTPFSTQEPLVWETYTNSKWGISFEYPKNWQLRTYSENGIGFQLNESIRVFYFFYLDNPKNLSLSEIDQENLKKYNEANQIGFPPITLISDKSVLTKVGTYEAYVEENPLSCEPVNCQRYIIPSKNKIMLIQVSLDSYPEYKSISERILSTFKFIKTD